VNHTAVVFQDKMYVFGGGGSGMYFNDIHSLDLSKFLFLPFLHLGDWRCCSSAQKRELGTKWRRLDELLQAARATVPLCREIEWL
jgi:hypothetical protein